MRGALVGLVVLSGAVLAVPAQATAPDQRVIVTGASADAAAAAVEHAGGHVLRRLDLVDAVSATLPAGVRLAGATPDRSLTPQSTDAGGSGTAVSSYRQTTRATGLAPAQRHATVAIVDTGISDVGGLGAKTLTVPDPITGKPARCANFSAEAGDCSDSYGHGTFLAGLIAGDGSYPGMDPDARLVSVKIAGRNGSADTSQVLAAIQWVVSFKDQLGIDVLNLSLGTDSNHDSRKDPLNRAVERAWQAGIVVVVAASNRGPAEGTISKPADDPLVVTVGAIDDRATWNRDDDTVAPFSGRGPVRQGTPDDPLTVYKPDVVAPGVGLVSLVSPGSHIEETAPPSSVGVAGYRRGSGTSQAAAVVSGAVALLLERRDWTPDEVKAALYVGAHRFWSQPFSAVGAGTVDVGSALDADVDGYQQRQPRQDGFDGLDLSRGSERVTSFGCSALRAQVDRDAGCTYVSGQLVALGTKATLVSPATLGRFDPADYGSGPWTGQSWYADQWTQGQSWYGQSWYGQSWYGQSWYEDSSTQRSAPTEGTVTDYGAVLPGSAWYGVWE